MENTKHKKLKKGLRIALKTFLWIIGIWFGLLVILQIVLTTPILTKIVNSYAEEYVDGDVRFGKVSINMFSDFPRAKLTFEDFSITYPTDRYADVKGLGAQGHLMSEGCGESADTLASISSFSASINLAALLTGEVSIPHLNLDKPRIFIHRYADGCANWDLFVLEESEDEEETEMPEITFGDVSLSGHPHIVYTDSKDTVFACISSRHIQLNGTLDLQNIAERKVGLTMDSTFVAGRMARDTVALGIDHLGLLENTAKRGVDIDCRMRFFAGTEDYGRIAVPIDIKGDVSFPRIMESTVEIGSLNIKIAHIPINTTGRFQLKEDRASVHAEIEIPECKVSEIKDKFLINFLPEAAKVNTDARLSMMILCDGDYVFETGSLPPVLAQFSVPKSKLSYEDIPGEEISFNLTLDAATDSEGRLNIDLTDLKAYGKGLDLYADGSIKDFMNDDPAIKFDAGVYANLDSLKRFIPDSLGIKAHGTLVALADGSAKMSQLDIYKFSESSLSADVIGERIFVEMPADSINADIHGLEIYLGPEERISRRDSSKTFHLVGISGKAGKIDITAADAFSLKTEDFSISAKNATDSPVVGEDGKKSYPFSGRISAGKLRFRDSEGTALSMHNTRNSFRINRKRDQPQVPVLTLTSRNEKLFAKADVNKVMLADADIKVRAEMNSVTGGKTDTLARRRMAQRRRTFVLPDWLQEEEFRKQDVNIALDKGIAEYFRQWNLDGSIGVSRGRLATPYFPLRNTLDTFDLRFTNDKIQIDRFGITSGESEISATGTLTGLRRALLGRKGALKLNIDASSDSMNINELLIAYSSGAAIDESMLQEAESLSDEEDMEEMIIDTANVEIQTPLIVIPANLVADISLNASNVKYDGLKIDSLKSEIIMKERCVQLTNTHAATNMGDIDLEGFYSTRTKKDLKTGFSAEFKNLTAEKAINLMPGLDTIIPLLKSFDGLINCELAATTQFDSDMNLLTPTMNGVMRISGENLSITDNDYFTDMAKTFMFKNKKETHVDRMMVEGIIKDNKFEVFPFVLDIDRYVLGLSGIQNMDMSYRYHVSLIKSPFLFKIGIDLYGDDFDDMKFKIGRAKYKNADIPMFSTVIDKTKINLVESIRNIFSKGVDAAVRENSSQKEISEHREKIGYVQAVDQKMEELTEEEKQQLEKELNIKKFEKK